MNKRTRGLLWVLGTVVLLRLAWLAGLPDWIAKSLDYVAGMGPWAPVLYFALYILACVFLIPGTLLTMGAGAIFGVGMGSVYASLAATAGATAAFLTGRYLARGWVARKIETEPHFRSVDHAVAREGWKIVFLTRLSPFFPFVLLNYFFGLTKVSLKQYILASWAGMIPGTILYAYIGSLAGDLARLGSGARVRTPMEWTLLAVGFVATIIVTIRVSRIAKKALADET